MTDSRQRVPGTDRVLAEPAIVAASRHLGRDLVKRTVHAAQQQARVGEIEPNQVIATALAALPSSPLSTRRVLNATGVLLHTNLGRAPLSDAAVGALADAAGTTDVELDLDTGTRGARGAGATTALLNAVPAADAAHVVNNGAGALALATTALAQGREIVLARGELVEIGDGFRIPELLTATGARLREVGTTNRVRLHDYQDAIEANTAFVLKVHPSNFLISGFTSTVPVAALSKLNAPLIVDIGSGLLAPNAALPNEPDAASTLTDGADLVTASGDKLLGGPQSGLILGKTQLVRRLRRHPLSRALRADKLTLAALEATLQGPATPIARALGQQQSALRPRADNIVARLHAAGIAATAHCSAATVGGGGAPGVDLPSVAVRVPDHFAARLRQGVPPVLARLERGHCAVDLFAIPSEADEELTQAIMAANL